MKRTLLLCIDCQNDFISGSMAVKDACSKIHNIIQYIEANISTITDISFTKDWHPSNHMSFVDNGGLWPAHCVQATFGAEIDRDLLECACRTNKLSKIYLKGMLQNVEEYSFLQSLASELRFKDLETYDHIIVCGIASEYCVLSTISDIIKRSTLAKHVSLLLDGIAYIENHDSLLSFANKNNIPILHI